jgi:hypothetical protein
MQRRKLLAALGSLAAGGATLMGTGAVSSIEAERAISGTTVNDTGANLVISPGNQHPGKVETAQNVGNDSDATGELALNFDNLNPDAYQAFDDVFRIGNAGGEGSENIQVGIEDAMDDVAFYFGEDVPEDVLFSQTTSGTPSISNGQEVKVGVVIDTRDIEATNNDDYRDGENDNNESNAVFTGTDGIGGDDDFLIQASEDLDNGPVQLGNGPSGNG